MDGFERSGAVVERPDRPDLCDVRRRRGVQASQQSRAVRAVDLLIDVGHVEQVQEERGLLVDAIVGVREVFRQRGEQGLLLVRVRNILPVLGRGEAADPAE